MENGLYIAVRTANQPKWRWSSAQNNERNTYKWCIISTYTLPRWKKHKLYYIDIAWNIEHLLGTHSAVLHTCFRVPFSAHGMVPNIQTCSVWANKHCRVKLHWFLLDPSEKIGPKQARRNWNSAKLPTNISPPSRGNKTLDQSVRVLP